MMNTRRREFLTMGVTGAAAGAAAFTLPSLFPTDNNIAFAQGRGASQGRGKASAAAGPDPILAEIMRQFQRMHAGMTASPPRGNAQQAAGAYRMLAAWARANKFDALLKQAVTDAVALDGHHNLVAKLSSFDYIADARKRGITLPPNFRNPTYVDIAKAIGYVKGGFSIENNWRVRARWLEKNAAKFDHQMALLNGRSPDASIRLIRLQDENQNGIPDVEESNGEPEPEPTYVQGTCTQNPDGSFNCSFTATVPENPACNDFELFATLAGVAMALFCLVYVWVCAFGYFAEGWWAMTMYYLNCF